MLRRVDDRGGQGVALRHLSGLANNDDETAAALPAHVRRDRTREFPRADHLGLEMPQQDIRRDIVDASRDVRSGIADDDVEAAEGLHGVLDQRRNVSRYADIRHEALRCRGLQRCDRLVEFAAFAAAYRDAATFFSETLRDGEADPARAAGDQRYLAGQSEVHSFASTENVTVIAAVDADRAAGSEVGTVRQQKRDEVCDFIRSAGAPERIGAREAR